MKKNKGDGLDEMRLAMECFPALSSAVACGAGDVYTEVPAKQSTPGCIRGALLALFTDYGQGYAGLLFGTIVGVVLG